MGDLSIPRIGPPILLQPNRQTDRGNTEIGTEAVQFPFWDFFPIFGALCLQCICTSQFKGEGGGGGRFQ